MMRFLLPLQIWAADNLLDLSAIHQQYPDMSGRQTRLNYHKGDLTFESDKPVEINAIPVDVNETTVIRLIPKRLSQRKEPPEPALRKRNCCQKYR